MSQKKSFIKSLKNWWKEEANKNKLEKERLGKLHKGFVWYGLRTLMWIVLFLLFYSIFFVQKEILQEYLALVYGILSLPLFILAIIHLDIYKKDLFEAILSLIISGISLGSSLLGFARI